MAAQAWIRGRLLGAGAFGSVNLAINREDGDVFAVKSVVVNEASEVAVQAIENEISLLQALDSRYVVRCLGSDWTEESGQSMRNVFLEYMPEGCLTDFVKQFASCGALDEHLLRTYTRSIVEGIEYLHSRGIVHCDIKGKNILVGNGNVKLTDFGSAKRVGGVMEMAEGDAVNCAAMVNGTPLWMAPEVVRQVEQGPASDIWSLGCTVVEMATGRAPWSNLAGMNHFVALYHIGCTDELPAAPAWLSAEAQDFLSHCFERDPRRRWTSAQLLQHPFLTTRFVAAPIAMKAPASPISVMHFPADCDSDLSASFVNSVPILAAPSLFKRGLVSAQAAVQEPVEEDWWSSPGSPDSGPWIVVRSPKNSSSPPSLALSSDRMALAADCSSSSVEALMVVRDGEDLVPNCAASESLVQQSTSISVIPVIQIAAGFDFCELASSEMDLCVARRLGEDRAYDNSVSLSDLENFQVLYFKENEDLSTRLILGFSVVMGTINEYSELVDQYINPQILLYWPLSHGRMLPSSYRCFVLHWKCGHSDQCVIQSLDEYTLSLILLKNIAPHNFTMCVCVCVCWIVLELL